MGLCPAGTPVDAPRTADVVMLDGKHVIEAVVDLQNKNPLLDADQGAHGIVLLDDFVSVQEHHQCQQRIR